MLLVVVVDERCRVGLAVACKEPRAASMRKCLRVSILQENDYSATVFFFTNALSDAGPKMRTNVSSGNGAVTLRHYNCAM